MEVEDEKIVPFVDIHSCTFTEGTRMQICFLSQESRSHTVFVKSYIT